MKFEAQNAHQFLLATPHRCAVPSANFSWSTEKIRSAARLVSAAAIPSAAGVLLGNSFVQWLCIGWMLGIAVLLHRLARQGQRRRALERVIKLANDFLPQPKILHPWPSVRFAVTTQGGSPMP